MNRYCLYDKVRRYVLQILNGYIDIEELKEESIQNLIVPSQWGSKAGIVGALHLAKAACLK